MMTCKHLAKEVPFENCMGDEDHIIKTKIQSSSETNCGSGGCPFEEENPTAVRVILIMWQSENTGFSCLRGVFLDTGPFYFDDNLDSKIGTIVSFKLIPYALPVGVGFTFTGKEGGYDSNKKNESAEVYKALIQFFTVF
ncbi:unnamed protein product [Allacma fusca]|uniref:Uncharacterized protein n=1 Tax=Allacma fusca TaxID=39272 RepID=A0A8J2NV41_9HEXA|nr:unnamed protein product [Allacma fusca]